MVSIPEIITWFIGVSVLVFGLSQYRYVRRIPHHLILTGSYLCMFLAWSFTVLEGFMWKDLFNALEHTSLFLGVLAATVWILRVVRQERLVI